ncbi:hypothetical protein TNCV_1547021 [Trichonephila clavipes]|nr:hypothetical protein TNCV_1547021 [Trichonephila clavipes]
MSDLSDIQKRQIVRIRLAGASIIEMHQLLVLFRGTVSEVMAAYTKRSKTSWTMQNRLRKEKLSEGDCHRY